MSRKWTSKDIEYIYNENLIIMNSELEPLINKIKSEIDKEIEIINIIDYYKSKVIINDNFFKPNNKYRIKCMNELRSVYRKALRILDKLVGLHVFYNTKFGDKIFDYYLQKYNDLVNIIDSFVI